MSDFQTQVRVYLEDTDAQGVVYHANYLKFFERARTDFLTERGPGLGALQDDGFYFVVHELQIKYLKPARLGEDLTITSRVERASPFRVVFHQSATRASSEAVTNAKVDIVAIDAAGQLVKITDAMVQL